MRRLQIIIFFGMYVLQTHSSFAQVVLDSTNLPIVGIFTYFTPIPDSPKIDAFMGIIDNGYNEINHVTDTNHSYYGHIGIEIRGSISQQWWYFQKSYGIETRDVLGNDSSAVILGMPDETDWILYSPYDDRTLMRNVITYELALDMGYWAPRTKFCEVLINDFISWDYKGLYVMMEKIKWDNNRVDIAKLDSTEISGDDLTGGYIFAVDRNINEPDSGFYSANQNDLFYSYKYPKGDVIAPEQKQYLQAFVDSFENAAASPDFDDPVNGYRKYVVDTTFMDFFFIQELSKSVDCYKRSAYMYKDKNSNGGKLHAGPVWDFNSAWHNVALCADYDAFDGWAYQQSCWVNSSFPVPDYWEQMLQDTVFTNDLRCRWTSLRQDVLSTENIFEMVDSIAAYIGEAQVREYEAYGFTENFTTEIENLKSWIGSRLQWLDDNMYGNCLEPTDNIPELSPAAFEISPNPNNGVFRLDYTGNANNEMVIINALGEKVFFQKNIKSTMLLDLTLVPGIYLVQITSIGSECSKKLVVTK